MFVGANVFNQDIGNWNTSRVFTMFQMFRNAFQFNQDIGSWNTSVVEDFTGMFWRATAFNNGGSDNINNWDTSNATKMKSMFMSAANFNQPLHSWTIKRGTNRNLLQNFLHGTISYNKDLSCLDTSVWTSTKSPKNWATNTQLVPSQYPKWGQSVPASCNAAPILLSSTPADNDLNTVSYTHLTLPTKA